MKFNIENFISEIHEKHKQFSIDEIKQLLYLEERVAKDSAMSTGKRLIITSITLTGIKDTDDKQPYSGDKIAFTHPFESGINMLIADNLKGKSSIFKIVKYALTGNNSLKPNIKKWLHQVLVNFRINDKEYTVYLNLEKRLRATLFNKLVTDLTKVDSFSDGILFTTNSEADYVTLIEDFFFGQFSYYALKWTQKSSQKDKVELHEASASWKTYFKSIYLESSDSGSLMYGEQDKKIFQMLLGLELTFPINRLTVEKDRLLFEKGKLNTFSEHQTAQKAKVKEELKIRLAAIQGELEEFDQIDNNRNDARKLLAEYDELFKKIQHENQKSLIVEHKLTHAKKTLEFIDIQRSQRKKESDQLLKEIQKTDKKIIDFEEYLEIGIFFSNLDVKHCPSCNHTISEHKKIAAAKENACSLCADLIDPAEIANHDEYDQKINNLKNVKQNQLNDLRNLQSHDDQVKYEDAYNEVIKIEQNKSNITDTTQWVERLSLIDQELAIESQKTKPDETKKNKLIAEQAVVKYQLDQDDQEVIESYENLNGKIQLLSTAIAELNNRRFEMGRSILSRLENLMLTEIHLMGMNSITAISINNKFDIQYVQDGDTITFENIAEGEQLRAKIAFYLSLIQLDIEYNFGRHTRFLIIDSPAKEEGDASYMEGLSLVLKAMEDRFGDKLQVLIGTAERNFQNVVKKQLITQPQQYVF